MKLLRREFIPSLADSTGDKLRRCWEGVGTMKYFGRNSWVLNEFLRHCYEAKKAEYHALDYIVMSRKRYEEVMEKAYPKERPVWIDEAYD